MSDIKNIASAITQEKPTNAGQMINNQNTMSDDSGSSWATTISQYLLQRREQTQVAYQDQLVMSSSEQTIDTQGWLFEALFEVLVQRLEEGHTVLVLDVSNNVLDDSMFNANLGLFAWQQQLLQPLLSPLWSIVANTTADISVTELLEDELIWSTAMRQSTLSVYDKQILEQRYKACAELYKYLINIAKSTASIENSLSNFIETIKNKPLFSENSEGKNNPKHPIIFQTNSNAENTITKVTFWLHRTWQAEFALAQHVMRIKEQALIELPITLNASLSDEQKDAIHMSNRSAFSIITGGPGTGKTFTVAQLVMALQQEKTESHENHDTKANLALAAPTGKAAQRMQESLQAAIQQANVAIALPEAKTIHRLLGIGQGGRPRYNKDNPLSEDIVIVDEASMLGVELANHLVSAIKPNARLILLGDANQLAAVDAGAVLADLCRIPVLQNVHQRLIASRRFTEDSGIGKLAKLINQATDKYPMDTAKMSAVWSLLEGDDALNFYHLINAKTDEANKTASNIKINSLSKYKLLKEISKSYIQYFDKTQKKLIKIKKAKFIPTEEYLNIFVELITILNEFRVLTAGHHGLCGDHKINQYLSEQHKALLKLPLSKSPWYHGRPVMVLQNNYELGLFNGDIGICMQTEKGRLQVFFENKKQGININMLSDEMIATAYAMTIHKSQGSEFDHVAISFDDNNARLLSQELIYTAVTRAKKQVSIFSTVSAFTRALSTPTMRQTGLSLQFEKMVE